MPLNVQGLRAARCDVTSNKFLQPVWRAVTNYNETGSTGNVAGLSARFEAFAKTGKLPAQKSGLTQRAESLQQIMQLAAGYLTCKPPGTKAGVRTDRWDALSALMADVTREAQDIGVKLVDSPQDFRAISSLSPSVWLEVTDPRHRSFGALSTHYEEWKSDQRAIDNKTPFWTWAGEKNINDIVEYDKSARYHVERGPDGKLSNIDGARLDTSKDKSHRGGDGWGIYAIDTEGDMFIARHNDTGERRLCCDAEACVPDRRKTRAGRRRNMRRQRRH